MRAAVLHKPGDIRIEDLEKPKPGPEDVLIRVRAVGICGSDIHYYRTGRIGDYVVKKPLILGHESAGEIAEVGENVEGFESGDRVIIEPGVGCRKCWYCKIGRYNLCRDEKFMATPPVDGTFAEYVAWPSDFVLHLPDHLSFEEGALIEPTTVAVNAVHKGEIRGGDIVAVLGSGPIGLVTLQVAKASGATTVYATDVEDYRLKLARKLGADEIIDVSREDSVARIMELTGGEGVDVTFEASGAVPAAQDAIKITKRAGRVVLVGMFSEEKFPLNVLDILLKELTVRGILRYACQYEIALKLVSSGKVDVKPLITHEFPLEQVEKAIKMVEERSENVVKAIIRP